MGQLSAEHVSVVVVVVSGLLMVLGVLMLVEAMKALKADGPAAA